MTPRSLTKVDSLNSVGVGMTSDVIAGFVPGTGSCCCCDPEGPSDCLLIWAELVIKEAVEGDALKDSVGELVWLTSGLEKG